MSMDDLSFLVEEAKRTLQIIGEAAMEGKSSIDVIFEEINFAPKRRFDLVMRIQPWANNMLHCSELFKGNDSYSGSKSVTFRGRKRFLKEVEAAVVETCDDGRSSDCDALLESLPGFDPIGCLLEDLKKGLSLSVGIYHGPWGCRPDIVGFKIVLDEVIVSELESSVRAIGGDMFI
jgi:hypothetical protein